MPKTSERELKRREEKALKQDKERKRIEAKIDEKRGIQRGANLRRTGTCRRSESTTGAGIYIHPNGRR